MLLVPEIIYEDEDIIAVNKPAGLVVHPDGRTKESSVSDWFAQKYPGSVDVGEPIIIRDEGSIKNSKFETRELIPRPGVVHRIDRDTSGVLLLAKTRKGHTHLKEQFQNREIEKVYHAFVHGYVKEDRGTINLPIGRSTSNFKKWSAQRGARGEKRDAFTYFEVLKRDSNKEFTFVEIKPKTGRTHQIRVHFQAIHHPIIGDPLYAPKKPRLLGFERLALHARRIGFKNLNNEKIFIEAPYPEDFKRALDIIGNGVLDY